MPEPKPENVKNIFGLKLKQLRQSHKFSLLDLARITGVSPSYLNEIEKGKKFPREDKIELLARALNTSYEAMISLKLTEKLGPLNDLFQNRFLKDLPLEMFGLEWNRMVDWMSQAPAKVNALVNTVIDIARSYNLSKEAFYFAALRTYQEMHQNYFEDLEEDLQAFIKKYDFNPAPPVRCRDLEKILGEEYHYRLDTFDLAAKPELRGIRSIYKPGSVPTLFLNPDLNTSQKLFVLAKELGFCYLRIKDRPQVSVLLKADHFDMVLNNFRASYFAAALLVNKNHLSNDLESYIKMEQWDPEQLLYMIRKYNVSVETLGHRVSNIVPKHFGLKELFFLRFQSKNSSYQYQLTKELHLKRSHTPWSNELLQNYCRRWSGIEAIKELENKQEDDMAIPQKIHIQRAHFHGTEQEYLVISLARPMDPTPAHNASISIGFALTKSFKKKVGFWDDPAIPTTLVGVTCETCAIKDCKLRAAEPSILAKEERKEQIRKAVETLLSEDIPVHDHSSINAL